LFQVHNDITRLSSTNHGRQPGEIKIRSVPFEEHKAGVDRERFFPFQLGIVNTKEIIRKATLSIKSLLTSLCQRSRKLSGFGKEGMGRFSGKCGFTYEFLNNYRGVECKGKCSFLSG